MSAWTWLFSDLSNECPYLRTNLRIYPHTQLLKQSNATNLRQTKLSTQLKYQLTALLFAHFLPEFTRVKWCGWFIIFTVRSTLLRPGINHGPVFELKQRARRKKNHPRHLSAGACNCGATLWPISWHLRFGTFWIATCSKNGKCPLKLNPIKMFQRWNVFL